MIFYFSGTGNSAYIAKMAAQKLGTQCVDIASTTDDSSFEGDAGTLGLVLPVYSWGIPPIVEKFIADKLCNIVKGRQLENIWCILTHGDDMGYADTILRKQLEAVGMRLDAVFSLAMPNTYVCLPGFDVDKNELADRKVKESGGAMDSICNDIINRLHCTKVTRGALPFTKTYVLRPLFNKFLLTDKYFHTVDARCIRCGRCAKFCPLHNITVTKEAVSWHGDCTGCLRCYHACPCNAIQFGWFTRGKGQKKFF